MTQLEKAREEIRRNTILMSFYTDRVQVFAPVLPHNNPMSALSNHMVCVTIPHALKQP